MSLDNTIHEIPMGDIRVSKENVRKTDVKNDLEELAASIRILGLLQPVVLLGTPGTPPYELISGQRRFLAHRMLNKKNIRSVFLGRMNKNDAIIRSVIENMQRLDLEYIDAAKAITGLYNHFGKDERKVQEATGLSIQRIREYLFVNDQATEKMKKLINNGKVKAVDVKRALRAANSDAKKAEDILELIAKNKPNKYQKSRLVLYGELNKTGTAKEIFSYSMKTHMEDNIVISLSEEIKAALVKATKVLDMEPEELASKAIHDWLRAQGFLQ